ncbi:glycogen synthesis protein GlgS [Pseudomonas lundensis]|uniref:glycogen synthesis protein n=1 Tax=Serratia proteamaculans TaxID=28151 RepID=UPI00298225A8|nr:glycogen synthesis protein [Serratia proteamaculans]MDW5498848.1 glycogen synthesis protein [Serratia proteamaculans]MDW5503905.1 glycogen synthesis protein GlgS [Pseudomonas lundensis]
MMKSVNRHLAAYSSNMDFLASSIALMEWQGREVDAGKVAGNMSESQSRLFFERLSYFRQLYQDASTAEHSL